jgi:hypothetical protein
MGVTLPTSCLVLLASSLVGGDCQGTLFVHATQWARAPWCADARMWPGAGDSMWVIGADDVAIWEDRQTDRQWIIGADGDVTAWEDSGTKVAKKSQFNKSREDSGTNVA